MKNLKKRILSFVSAAAMAVSLLPTTSLFASAGSSTQEVYAIVSGSKNSDLTYFDGEDSYTKVDKDFLNNEGDHTVGVGLPFSVDDISSTTTYKIDIYARGQGKPKVRVWNANRDNLKSSDVFSDGNWNTLTTDPVTITMSGSDFSTAGTYYAGVKANNYMNFYKIYVTKTTAGEFSVSATTSDATMGSASVNKSTADSGETATFTATAESGYKFVNWTDNNSGAEVSTDNPYSATVTGNMSLQANFQEIPDTEVEVKANNNAYGYVINKDTEATVNSVRLLNDAGVTLKAKNRDGYLFVNWTVMEEDGSNKQSLGTRSKISISDIAPTLGRYTSPILMANFGAKTAVRFEAENFTDFISETKYHNLGYDDPTAVLQGNTGYTAVSGSTTDPYKYDTTNNNTFGDGHKAGTASGSSTTIAGGKNYGGEYNSKQTFSGLELSAYASAKVTVGTKNSGYGWYKVSVKNNSTGVTTKVAEGDTDSTVNVDISSYCNDNYDVIVDINGNRWIAVEGTTAASAELGKIENWDNKSYSNLKVASTYSNGAAAALTGPSNGLAIPFYLEEALDDNLEIELGYNYGTLSDTYKNTYGTTWTGGLYVNLYTTADYSTVERLITDQGGWTKSGNATPENASNFLRSQGEFSGEAFYRLLSKGDHASEVQKAKITLPAGLPAGTYMLSVATDQNNCRSGENGNDYVDSVGTAYYDYIQFYTASTPDQPSPLTVGANFIFTDKWGNDLMTNAVSKSTYNANTNKVLFHPSAPRYLVAQGYNIVGWTIEKLENGSYQPLSGYTFTYGGTPYTTDSNGYVSLRANGEAAYDWTTEKVNIDNGCFAINGASFAAGSTIKFKAEYAVAVDQKTVTITNGKIYRKSNSSDTDLRSLLLDGTGDHASSEKPSTKIPNFGEIRLEPSFEQGDAVFSYWTLNGMIYSFDADIRFSAWTNADFTAHIADENPKTAVAFIDSIVRTSGFELDDVNYHKITFDCAFYVPTGSTYVSSGIVYSNYTDAVKGANVATVDANTGALTVTSNTEGKNVLYNTVKANLLLGGKDSNKYNRQVMVSLSNMKTGATRAARAYMIYKQQDGEYKIALSKNVVTATAAISPNASSVSAE